MKGLQLFLLNFFKNNGHFVFGSAFIGKVTGFLISLIAINFLSESDFGLVSIVNSISLVFIAMNGLGSNQIVLRYGSVLTLNEDKEGLSNYYLKNGLIKEIVLVLIFLMTSIFYIQKYDHIIFLFILFSFRLVGFYFFNHIQSELRIKGDNKGFSRVCNAVNLGMLVSVMLLTYNFGMYGYLFAICFTPFISIFWISTKVSNFSFKNLFSLSELRKYGYFTVFTAVLSDLLFSVDIILLGHFFNETSVANYRTAMLIPANIVFLSSIFMQSDYPVIAKNSDNRSYLEFYVRNYYKLFIPIVFSILLGGLIFRKWIINLFFSSQYSDISTVFAIALIGFSISMLSRNLYGNMLSALGLMKFNTISSAFTLFVLIGLSFFLVPKYEVLGMAISMFVSLLLSGFLLSFFFYKHLRKL